MKFNRLSNLIITAMLALGAIAASAQSGFDMFGVPRTAVLSTPQVITVSSAAYVTNGPIDTHGFLGTAKVDIFSVTNGSGAGTMTAQLYTSSDTTNLTALSTYALATSTTVTYTNAGLGAGTNISASTTYLLPGVLTTPTAATAGWATPYLATPQFTNAGAITITGKGIYSIGYNIADANRYLYIVYAPGGTVTNCAVGAVLTGRRGSEVR